MKIIFAPFIWLYNNIKNDMIAELKRVRSQTQEELDDTAW